MNNEFTQEELKELFFRIMTEDELKKLDKLEMDEEISKLNSSTFQIKYFNDIGYVFIGNGYLIMTDGIEKQQFFCTVCKDEESAKQEIIDRLNK